jgi:exodeoxyribonuclease VII small subunit
MKTDLTYSEAFSKLEEIVDEFEVGNIQLDKLSEKIKQAHELIAICETKLRNIEKEIDDAAKNSREKIEEL